MLMLGAMRQLLFLLSSARPRGNSAALARQAASGLSAAAVTWVDLATARLPHFTDTRPAPPPPLAPVLRDILGQMMRADDLVVVAPVYWYALPAPAKLLLDHWSGFLDAPDLRFAERMANKRLWLITTRADAAADVPTPLETMVRRSGDWLGMRWCGALHAVADAPDTVQSDPAWEKAQEFLTLPA